MKALPAKNCPPLPASTFSILVHIHCNDDDDDDDDDDGNDDDDDDNDDDDDQDARYKNITASCLCPEMQKCVIMKMSKGWKNFLFIST